MIRSKRCNQGLQHARITLINFSGVMRKCRCTVRAHDRSSVRRPTELKHTHVETYTALQMYKSNVHFNHGQQELPLVPQIIESIINRMRFHTYLIAASIFLASRLANATLIQRADSDTTIYDACQYYLLCISCAAAHSIDLTHSDCPQYQWPHQCGTFRVPSSTRCYCGQPMLRNLSPTQRRLLLLRKGSCWLVSNIFIGLIMCNLSVAEG